MKNLTRRDFLNVCSKENLKHIFHAWNGFQEGVKEKTRRSCDEVGKQFFKKRLHQQEFYKNRKEG